MDATNFAQPPQAITSYPTDVRALAYSPDGSLLALMDESPRGVDGYGTLQLVDIAKQTARLSWRLMLSPLDLAFSPNGKYLAYATALPDYPIQMPLTNVCVISILDMSQNPPRGVYDFDCPYQYGSSGQSAFRLVFSPDSNWLAAGRQPHDIQLINLNTGRVTTTSLVFEDAHGLELGSLAFSPDSKQLVINPSYYPAASAHLIWLESMEQSTTWYDQETVTRHPIEGNLFYSDDQQKVYEVVTQNYVSTLKIWDIKRGQQLASAVLPGLYGIVDQNLRNHTLILDRLDSSGESTDPSTPPDFLVVDDQTGHIVFSFNGMGATLSPDGKRLIVTKYSTVVIEVIDASTGHKEALPPFWTGRVVNFKFLLNDTLLSVNTASGVHFWDLRQNVALNFNVSFSRAVVSPDGKWLAGQRYRSPSPDIELYDFQTHKLVHTVSLPTSPLHLAFSSDSQTLIAVFHETYPVDTSYVARIDVKSGKLTRFPNLSVALPNNGLTGISEDGRLILLYTQSEVVIWNIETNTMTPLTSARNNPFIDWTFSTDGTLVAAIEPSDSNNGLGYLPTSHHLAVWNTSSGELLRSLRTPIAYIGDEYNQNRSAHISFSPAGDRVYALSSAWLQPAAWDIATGNQVSIYPLIAHSSVASPMQAVLAVAAQDHVYLLSATTPTICWDWPYGMKDVSFSHNGQWLVGRSEDSETLTLFAVDDARIPTPQPPPLTPIASR
ncbi:MAG: WD40 repeat domain-containing protein [Anaerolineae bacterium]|nr:WD40 repeat domain-containing protein [Anaerolineae bacterium]